MTATDTESALFTSGQSALSFAYRHTQGNFSRNQLATLQKAARQSSPQQPMLAALDGALAAGLVRNIIEGGNGRPGIPEPYRSILLAKFSVDSNTNLPAKLVVLEAVMALAMGTGLHKRRMVDLCVQRYFGGTVLCADGVRRPIRQHQVADWCEVSQPTVSNAYVRIKAWLMGKEQEAMDMVEAELQRRGMVA